MKGKDAEADWHGFASCEDCGIRDLVLFADLDGQDLETIHLPIEDIHLAPGASLYGAGQEAVALYTVREGLLKQEQYLPDGTLRIVSLLRRGDVAGLEALVAAEYEHTTVALQPAKVCRLPKELVSRLSPKLHRQLMNKWNGAVQRSHECTRELSTGTARQRVARLFLILAAADSASCRLFSREDMGGLLGITTQTASRIVAEFKRQGAVHEVAPNLFERSLDALRRIAAEG
ncbi:MAG TPA: Crp/Fnr family transcriptional regulator [Candidatus Sulfotelmatobacter sp.]|jgi:CRP-like cAMP-binding protein|nr:Crp/Fnr family transcriptional regulator [Candidatus Sulfotelmatobacter sp.]